MATFSVARTLFGVSRTTSSIKYLKKSRRSRSRGRARSRPGKCSSTANGSTRVAQCCRSYGCARALICRPPPFYEVQKLPSRRGVHAPRARRVRDLSEELRDAVLVHRFEYGVAGYRFLRKERSYDRYERYRREAPHCCGTQHHNSQCAQ